MKKAPDDNPWTETVATVVACDDDSNYPGNYRRDGTLIVPKFAVQFTYPANGNSYAGQYTSRVPVPSGHQFTILYDPSDPQQNTGGDAPSTSGNTKLWVPLLIAVGVVLWLVFWQFTNNR
jgi:hypothetical protein